MVLELDWIEAPDGPMLYTSWCDAHKIGLVACREVLESHACFQQLYYLGEAINNITIGWKIMLECAESIGVLMHFTKFLL